MVANIDVNLSQLMRTGAEKFDGVGGGHAAAAGAKITKDKLDGFSQIIWKQMSLTCQDTRSFWIISLKKRQRLFKRALDPDNVNFPQKDLRLYKQKILITNLFLILRVRNNMKSD